MCPDYMDTQKKSTVQQQKVNNTTGGLVLMNIRQMLGRPSACQWDTQGVNIKKQIFT